MRRAWLAVAAFALAACAKNPDAIAPIAMPVNAYFGLTCDQLVTEHQRSSAALAAVSQQQKQAATGDAVGVFLIGVPVSSLSGGDKEGLVAQHKGALVARGAGRRGRPAPRPAAPPAAPAPGPVRAAQ